MKLVSAIRLLRRQRDFTITKLLPRCVTPQSVEFNDAMVKAYGIAIARLEAENQLRTDVYNEALAKGWRKPPDNPADSQVVDNKGLSETVGAS